VPFPQLQQNQPRQAPQRMDQQDSLRGSGGSGQSAPQYAYDPFELQHDAARPEWQC
jgi:hypothetical protein